MVTHGSWGVKHYDLKITWCVRLPSNSFCAEFFCKNLSVCEQWGFLLLDLPTEFHCIVLSKACTVSLHGLPKTKNDEVLLKVKHMTLNKDIVAQVIQRYELVHCMYSLSVRVFEVFQHCKTDWRQHATHGQMDWAY